MSKRFFLILSGLLAISCIAQAQLTISPYSRFGVGELIHANSSRNTSMGGLGIGVSNWSNINRANPASYADLLFTTLDISGFSEYRTQKSDNYSNDAISGGFHNLSFGFPSNKKFAFAFGLAPYSISGYDIVTADTLLADSVSEPYFTNYTSTGGINQFYLGAGFKVIPKLSLGANLGLNFGSTENGWTNVFESQNYRPVIVNDAANVRGVSFTFGAQYEDTLKFNRRVDLYKDQLKKKKDALELIEDVKRAKTNLAKSKEQLEKDRVEADREIESLEAKRFKAEEEVERLRAARAAENEVNRAEAIERKYSRKIKKIRLKLNMENRKLQEDERFLVRREEKLRDGVTRMDERLETLVGDSARRYTSSKEKLMFRVGGVFEPAATLSGERLVTYNNTQVLDTLSFGTGEIKLPLRYGFGFSLGQPGKWTAGLDISIQDWSKFSFFNEASNLGQSLRVNAGAEWTPDLRSTKYTSRISWRAGAYYNATPVELQGNSITETGVTFGVGLPLGRVPFGRPDKHKTARVFPRINLGLTYAQMGTLENGLLQESVIKLRFGVNLTDRWFFIPKVD